MRTLSYLLLSLSLVAPAWALGGRDAAPPPALRGEARAVWAPVIAAGTREGVPAEHLERTAAHLAAAGLSAEEGRAVLAPALRAAREGLPAGQVLTKLDEGAQKGASAGALVTAGEARRLALEGARGLLGARGYPDEQDRGQGLIIATALALESGVLQHSLEAVLDRGRGAPPGQVKAVVEAGETLHLAGLDPETVEALMTDCLERDLRRPEVLRVVRFAQEGARAGTGGPAIREALWGGGGAPRGGSPAGGGGSSAGGSGGYGGPGGRGGPGGGRGGGNR